MKNEGGITVYLYETVVVSDPDNGSFVPESAGEYSVIYAAVKENEEKTLEKEFLGTDITEYTFEATSEYTGSVSVGFATANTNVILRNIVVAEVFNVSLPETVAAGEVAVASYVSASEGWQITGVTVFDAFGEEIVLADGVASLAAGQYTVVYTVGLTDASAKVAKTSAIAAVFTVE